MRHLRLLAIPVAIAVFAATKLVADVITAPPLSGNFALTLAGFELITPGSLNSLHLDIKGEGLVTADGAGNLTGGATLVAANGVVPEPAGDTVAAPCTGALSGTVTEPGDGTAQIQLNFTPASAPSGVGAQDACIPTALALNCVEEFGQFGFFPLGAGLTNALGNPLPQGPQSRCTPGTGKGDDPHHRRQRHGGKKGADVAVPIAWPFFFPSGAREVKCVVAGATTTSTAVSIDGASLSLNLKQTPPASVVVPTPAPEPTFVPQGSPEQPPPTPAAGSGWVSGTGPTAR